MAHCAWRGGSASGYHGILLHLHSERVYLSEPAHSQGRLETVAGKIGKQDPAALCAYV